MTRKPIVVAEIGCNHKGDMNIAREMIKVASSYCRADYVKFQKRTPRELLNEVEYNTPHPNPMHSYGKTYGEHREFLEFNVDQHRQLISWCREENIKYATSVWDVTSAREIAALQPDYIKVPSACNTNFKLLSVLADEYQGKIHISFGMTDRNEEKEIISFFEKKKRNKDLVVYSCTSGYPVPFENICLLEIQRLQESYGAKVDQIAFSGHHLGIAADVAAFTLGANWIERHFTLDRTWKGTDHAASLEPDGLRKLCRDLKNISLALTYKKTEILEIEQTQRNKLKRFEKA